MEVELLVVVDDRLSAEAAFGHGAAPGAIDFAEPADGSHHLFGVVAHEARQAFLDAACRDDRALREEVESLLAAHEDAGDFLSTRHLQQPLASPAPVDAAR